MWSKASRVGALAGMGSGFALWFYCLFFPALVDSGILAMSAWLVDGPWGIQALAPRSLLGMEGLDKISHGVFWSFSLNVALFCLGSILFPGNKDEQLYYRELQSYLTADTDPVLELDLKAYIDLNQRCHLVSIALVLFHINYDQLLYSR